MNTDVSTLIVERPKPGLVRAVLNRPERRNALNLELLEALAGLIAETADRPQDRVLILEGAGPVFCAGLDLKEAADVDTAERGSKRVGEVIAGLIGSPLVTIAAAQGAAMAGGAGLLAACDLAIVTKDLKLGFPEVRRGLVPAIVSVALKRKLLDGDLRALLLTGSTIEATEALRMGLVHRVVSEESLRSESDALAAALLETAPNAQRETKRLIAQLDGDAGPADFAKAEEFHMKARVSAEAKEGLAAFLEKRAPNWAAGEDRS